MMVDAKGKSAGVSHGIRIHEFPYFAQDDKLLMALLVNENCGS
jgi:hypothetical protein